MVPTGGESGRRFRSTQIPACLWFLSRGRRNGAHRDRPGEVLFIDARKRGQMVDRTHRDLPADDIARVAGADSDRTRGDMIPTPVG